LYARSRFVVIPLHQTDTDNGVTAIEESMAMGKAIICTRTKGQVDIIQENVTGIFVPPYDPQAMREAILYLWNNPDVAKRMGEAGRKHIEKYHTLDLFVDSVKKVVDEVIEESERKN
jgi:glycosyltransferase involved in cell wall biosynthesis